MASTCASLCAAPAAAAVAKAQPARRTSFTGLARIQLTKAETTFEQVTVSNGVKTRQMLVWQPTNNKQFETFSYLPPLTSDQIAKQVDYIVNNGWTPCLEVSEPEFAYVGSQSLVRTTGAVACNYYDNRYWTMYKLPMFGCTDPGQVLAEIRNATRAFPGSYVRLVAFDANRQVQITGFLVHRPPTSNEWKKPEERSV